MQNASVNFATAATGSTRLLADPLLLADWAGDGIDQATLVGGARLYDGFETGVDAWTTSSATFVQSAAQAHGGTYAGLLTVTGSPSQAYVRRRLPVEPARRYALALWVYSPVGYGDVGCSVDWFDALGSYLSTTSSAGSALPATRWTARTLTATAPAGAAYADVGPTVGNNPPTGTQLYTDDVTFAHADAWDDLSHQLGRWTVSHHLDDGFPDAVTFVSGVGFADLKADVTGRWVADVGPMNADQYWSPYRTDSPIFTYDRDVAPVRLEAGLVTAGGQERIRLFTGQMTDAPVKRGAVTMSAVSRTRLKLAKLVQPPSTGSVMHGAMTGTWPVSWAAAQCGVYSSPPPRPDARWWAPLHGGLRAFLPTDNRVIDNDGLLASTTLYTGEQMFEWAIDNLGVSTGGPEYVTGPFVLGVLAGIGVGTPDVESLTTGIQLEPGTDLLSQAGNAGRFECWVRGDAADTNHYPGGSGAMSKLSGLELNGTNDLFSAKMGVGTDRKTFVTVDDGAGHVITLKSSDTLPTDGAWYFVGAAYDVANKKLWCTNFNGTTASTGAPTLVTTSLPAVDDFRTVNETLSVTAPWWITRLPAAELHLTAGAQANVDNFPAWLNTVAWTQGLAIHPSKLAPVVFVEPSPVEAWQLVAEHAQAELASLRTTEADLLEYRSLGWWVQDAQQVVSQLVSTSRNAAGIDVNRDPSKIRNSVRVSYTSVDQDQLTVGVLQSTNVYTIPSGTSFLDLAFTGGQVFQLYGNPVDTVSDLVTFDNPNFLTPGTVWNYVVLNAASDGSGLFATSTQVTVSIVAWVPNRVLLKFANLAGAPWFTATGSSVPSIVLTGRAARLTDASVVDSDDTSIAARGERGMTLDVSRITSDIDARRLARDLKMGLRFAVDTVGPIAVVGDHRRQPGDLATLTDAPNTAVSGTWRVQTVDHRGDRASYTQQVTARRTLPIMVVGEGLVGYSLIGPEG